MCIIVRKGGVYGTNCKVFAKLKFANNIYICLSTLVCRVHVAAQMLLLAKLLPLAIGDRVPTDDDRWMNFLRMREIISYLFCPNVAEDDAAYLQVKLVDPKQDYCQTVMYQVFDLNHYTSQALISDHHTEFCHIYPGESVIPKMHFMVHMPRLMLQ